MKIEVCNSGSGPLLAARPTDGEHTIEASGITLHEETVRPRALHTKRDDWSGMIKGMRHFVRSHGEGLDD